MTRFTLKTTALPALFLIAGSSHAQNQISGEDWMASMTTSLPEFFCQTDQYFMQCFNVGEEECRAVAKLEAGRCLDEMRSQIPALLDMPADGIKWGTDVGRCAGIGYDLALAERKSEAVRCNPRG